MKQKKKKKERPRRSACYGHRKNKSFIESKHIFWKQGTDVRSLFSGITERRQRENPFFEEVIPLGLPFKVSRDWRYPAPHKQRGKDSNTQLPLQKHYP